MIEFVILLLFMNLVSFYMGTLLGRKYGRYLLELVAIQLLKDGMPQQEVVNLFDKIAVNVKQKDTQ